MTTPRPLATKIARIMGELARVPKNGRNAFHNYDYVTESDLVDELRHRLAAHGVAILPSVVDHVVTATTERGKSSSLATVTLELTFVDGESGDLMVTRWIGQGMDQGDKAYYKAYTGAFKYGLMKTFLISTGDDPEQDEQDAPVKPVKPAPQQREDRRQRQQTAPAAAPRQDPSELTESFKLLNKLWHAVVTDALEGDKEAVDAVRDAVKTKAGVESWRDMNECDIEMMVDRWGAMPVQARGEYIKDRYLRSE